MDVALSSDSPTHSAGGSLAGGGFLGLLSTQFLTALNDNIFRWLVIGISKDIAPEQIDNVLMAGTAAFVLPYLVLAAPAGYMADRFPKRSVIVGCKIAEVLIMVLGVGAILYGGTGSGSGSLMPLVLMMVTVALLGSQAAMFSPARAGSIPELLKPELISKANGFFTLATVIASVIGMVVGNALADTLSPGQPGGLDRWWLSAAVLIGVAVLGTLTSLPINHLPPGDPTRKFPWDAPIQTWRDLQALAASLPMLRVAFGVAFFYAVGALAQLNIDQLASEGGALLESAKSPLLLSLIAGVCVGSILAGFWSGDHVELGILPLGAFGVALFSMLLFTVPQTLFVTAAPVTPGFIWACVLLGFLGISAGLFNVPLEAYLQHRSPRANRGSILAATQLPDVQRNLPRLLPVCCPADENLGCRSPGQDRALLAARDFPRRRPADDSRLLLHRRADPAGLDPLLRLAARA